MKHGAKQEHLQHVVELVRRRGLKDRVIHGTERTIVACIGESPSADNSAIENAPMVERVVPILAPYKMASAEARK
ncbi:MAG: 3-deoxy-7-phosphoheptulonate synthase, partial [Phycisphaerae bacterium]